MSSRRVLPLVLGVCGLLAVAAIAAHGHPIGHSNGRGPTTGFFDYVFTSTALLAVAIVVVMAWSLLGAKWVKPAKQHGVSPLQLLASFLMAILVSVLLLHAHYHFKPKQLNANTARSNGGAGAAAEPPRAGRRNARLQWDEVAIVLGLLAALGVAAFATRSWSAKPMKDWHFGSHEEVALALDESLDDLRTEPDVRRAIIAAYARMERALAAAGLPRRPSEAPFEYLARALQSLDASAAAVTRLTDLFERAKFSHHEPDEAMRSEAIDALVAIRDELRRPAEAAA